MRKSDQSEENFERFTCVHKKQQNSESIQSFHENKLQNQKSFTSKLPSNVGTSLSRENRESFDGKNFNFLKDKIRKFENPPNNIHENIINRSTTTIRTEEATAVVDPVESVSENDQRISGDKNSRFRSTFLINRDESQSKRISSRERYNSKKPLSDGNNNQLKRTSNNSDHNSSLQNRSHCDVKDTNTHHHCNYSDDATKVSKVVKKRQPAIIVKYKSQVESHQQPSTLVVPKQNDLNDCGIRFIDASSQSVSRSSSTSYVSEDFGVADEKVNQRKVRIPKLERFNNCNYSQELSVKTSANENNYSLISAQNGKKSTVHEGIYMKNNVKNSVSPINDQSFKEFANSFSLHTIDQSDSSLVSLIIV